MRRLTSLYVYFDEVYLALTPQLILSASSDRGLCGAIHSGIAKQIKLYLKTLPAVWERKRGSIVSHP